MTTDPIADARKTLIQQRDEHVAATLRLNQAITALDAVLSGHQQRTGEQGRPSVRTMLLRLLEEGDKDWSVSDVLSEYQRRGTPVHGKDPSNALRAAVADAYKAKLIQRTTTGRYKAAKWPILKFGDDAEPAPPGEEPF